MRGAKWSPWRHVKEAHTHLLLAYASVAATHICADALHRGMRACALAMSELSVGPAQEAAEVCRTATNKRKPKRKPRASAVR